MAGWDWNQYAVGGATRPDSFSGMNGDFSSALQNLFAGAPEEIRANLRVGSGFRSPERQTQLWNQALQKYGSPEAARKWVAPPGRSQHNHGNAADLKYMNDAARAWVHANAGNYGLSFPLSNENWHIELAGARGGGHAPNDGHNHGAPVAVAAGKGMATAPSGIVNPAAPPATLADMFGGQTSVPVAGPPGGLGSAALLFAQQQMARQQARADEQAAEEERRRALFAPDSLAGLFG
jgi:hypothetical protein